MRDSRGRGSMRNATWQELESYVEWVGSLCQGESFVRRAIVFQVGHICSKLCNTAEVRILSLDSCNLPLTCTQDNLGFGKTLYLDNLL
jgi:hypothetical protein